MDHYAHGQDVAVSRESFQSALHQNRNKPRNKSGCTRVLVRGIWGGQREWREKNASNDEVIFF